MFKAQSVISVSPADVHVGVVRTVRGSLAVERAVDATRPPWLQRLKSVVGLIAVIWAVPFFVVALPLALAWRAVLEATRWRST